MSGLALGIVFAALAVLNGRFDGNGCHAEWTGRRLTVGNGLFTRDYAVSGGVLRTLSFAGASGDFLWQRLKDGDCEDFAVRAEPVRWSPVGSEGLRVTVKTSVGETAIDLYPRMPGVLVRRPGAADVSGAHDLDRDFTRLDVLRQMLNPLQTAGDRLFFRSAHIRATSLTCVDQTDMRDNLLDVSERLLMSSDSLFSIGATALDCREVLTGGGLVLVRLAPMPASRPGRVDDFLLDAKSVTPLANGYPLAELVYDGGEAGRQRALVAFQRALRPYRPGRDGILLSNTWGAGNGDERICQEFLLKEIEAGAKMGVDVIQIDDGWQHGRTANSSKRANAGREKVWNGYWAADPAFWTEDRERFPDGLGFLVKKAAERGLRFGLWFGPDSSGEAENWQRDADCLLDFHRRLGVDYFKMDSMKLHTPLALRRNRMMFDRMMELSDGKMVFDLDCTAEVRPGFFGLIDIGPLFVENRYSRRGSYWPHHTLKNLWDLSHVIDPVRLRMEFDNPDTNHGLYGDDPLAHAKYRPDTLFAMVMAASPLAWMELSDVTDASLLQIASLVMRWKQERERWYGGVIHPVGSRPDGLSWTGFVSEAADGRGGYALIFRELNAKDRHAFDLGEIYADRLPKTATTIGGRGTVRLDGAVLEATIPEKLDYLWIRVD